MASDPPTTYSGDDLDRALLDLRQAFALIVDGLELLRDGATAPEQKRLASIAITEVEGAAMWAVKALTWDS